MAIKQSNVLEAAVGNGVKFTIYGRGGMGKTMLVATLPGRTALGSVEAGLLSLSKANQARVFGAKNVNHNVEAFELETLEDLSTFHEWMSDPDAPFDNIALDSISEIAERVLLNALATVKDPRQAYGALMQQIVAMFWKFRALDKNVVFIAQECPNKEGNTPLHIPFMPGAKLAARVPYLFDELFHMNVGKLEDGTTYRYLQTQPSLEFDAKDRSGALELIEEPNLTTLINKIVS